ncbi:hypothetical protein [Streptomyces griseus]|uniref:hypothetical protein n=1 Tax=Streptomyces griseus TaxID=1911 RepID=UPI0005655DAE|nr:hypothetical protein [Streptomyces griseus]
MRTRTARIVHVIVAVALFAAGTGCGGEKTVDGRVPRAREVEQDPKAAARARQVADAWDGSAAAEAWRTGFHPMGDAVELPEDAFRTEADKEVYATQNFVLRGTLPATPRKDGLVKWASGGSLALPLWEARKAYESVARGRNDGPRLTVTRARLGEMTLATNRGPATVPAWLFTLEGYDTPLKRVALSPSKPPRAPIRPAPETRDYQMGPLGGLVRVAGKGRSVTVMAEHGACDDGPAVHVLETAGSVVLSASILGTDDGPCTTQAIGEKVTVTLKRPLGDRVLLDACTGRPVPYQQRFGASPSPR